MTHTKPAGILRYLGTQAEPSKTKEINFRIFKKLFGKEKLSFSGLGIGMRRRQEEVEVEWIQRKWNGKVESSFEPQSKSRMKPALKSMNSFSCLN